MLDESTGVRSSLETPSFAHIFAIINNNKYLSIKNSGNVTFSKSNSNSSIYSGNFSLELKNINNENDIINITEGRFDINLNTLNN